MIGKTNKQTNRDYYFIYTDALIDSPSSSTCTTDIQIY